MPLRPAPTYDNGLAIPPRKRDCVGPELCPLYQRQRRCELTAHHLYFEEDMYLSAGEPYIQLRLDSASIIGIAACRHNQDYPNSWHNRYDFTPLPKKDITYRYLEEVRFLRRLGVTVEHMAKELKLLDPQHAKDRYRLEEPGVREKRVERLFGHISIYESCMQRKDDLEVVPPAIVGRALTEYGYKRNQIASRALELVGVTF